MQIRILDLYCGMGGLSLGFALAIEGAEILGLDIDRDAVTTYNHNLNRFNARAMVQDVLKWEPEGEFDAVIGGSPCQPFSLAVNPRYGKVGKTHPLYPTFPRFFDIVLALRPKVFLLENVKGLITKRHRHLLDEQLARVEPYYNVKFQVLNVAYYGVPQRRERLFVLGIRRDLGIQPSLPKPTHAEEERATLAGRLFRWVTVREAIGDLLEIPPQGLVLTHKRSLTGRVIEGTWRPVFTSEEPSFTVTDSGIRILSPEQVERIRKEREDTSRHFARMGFPDSLDEPSRTISSHTVEGTKRETIVIPLTEHVMTEKGGWDSPKSDWGSRVIDVGKPSYTITEKHRSGQIVSVAYRRLTVRECLRLQSFPDWWAFPNSISISKRYKLVGEAVPPILAYRIAVYIAKLMGWGTREPPKPEEWNLPYFYRAFADYYSI